VQPACSLWAQWCSLLHCSVAYPPTPIPVRLIRHIPLPLTHVQLEVALKLEEAEQAEFLAHHVSVDRCDG